MCEEGDTVFTRNTYLCSHVRPLFLSQLQNGLQDKMLVQLVGRRSNQCFMCKGGGQFGGNNIVTDKGSMLYLCPLTCLGLQRAPNIVCPLTCLPQLQRAPNIVCPLTCFPQLQRAPNIVCPLTCHPSNCKGHPTLRASLIQ